MQVTITGHHIEITQGLCDRVANRLERVERHFEQINNAHVILTVEKLRHKAEATLNVPGDRLHAEAVEDDMYVAIDTLADRLDRRILKFKGKLTDHHARDVPRIIEPE